MVPSSRVTKDMARLQTYISSLIKHPHFKTKACAFDFLFYLYTLDKPSLLLQASEYESCFPLKEFIHSKPCKESYYRLALSYGKPYRLNAYSLYQPESGWLVDIHPHKTCTFHLPRFANWICSFNAHQQNRVGWSTLPIPLRLEYLNSKTLPSRALLMLLSDFNIPIRVTGYNEEALPALSQLAKLKSQIGLHVHDANFHNEHYWNLMKSRACTRFHFTRYSLLPKWTDLQRQKLFNILTKKPELTLIFSNSDQINKGRVLFELCAFLKASRTHRIKIHVNRKIYHNIPMSNFDIHWDDVQELSERPLQYNRGQTQIFFEAQPPVYQQRFFKGLSYAKEYVKDNLEFFFCGLRL